MRLISPKDILRGRKGRLDFLYGPPGHGKTSLIATAADPVIISTDPQGLLPVMGVKALEGRIVLVRTMEEMIDVIENANKLPGQDVFLDTVTILQKMDSYNVRLEATEKNPARNMKPSENEWTDLNRRLIDVIIRWCFSTSTKNLCFVGHQRIERDKESNIIGYNPDVLPQTMNAVLQFFNGVFYYKITAKKGDVATRTLFTQSVGTIATTKSRYGIPARYDNPTWARVSSDIEGWINSHVSD